MFALVDANSFYCSAEQVFNPRWRGKPLVVLSNNDGCIVAANKQALALGIKKFQPYFKMRKLCESQGIIACSSNYELYADLSHKMMQVIARFAPEQYIYSIDESFLSFEHCKHSANELIQQGHLLRNAVWKETRLPVCVGFAPTLTLAKLANHMAKKQVNYAGVCHLENQQLIQNLFKTLTPGDIWGIGRKTTSKLLALGIDNVQKLASLRPYMLTSAFNVEVERTIKELNGISCIGWDITRSDKQQIYSTRSVGQRITDIEALHQALATHVSIAAVKARKQQSLCGTLVAFASSSPFDARPSSFKISKHFTPPTNDTSTLIEAISTSMHELFKPQVRYYKIGVGLINLSQTQHQQLELFSHTKQNNELMLVLDAINQRYGRDSAFIAAQGIQQKWNMRRQLLTPQYTTRWQDIPKISCK